MLKNCFKRNAQNTTYGRAYLLLAIWALLALPPALTFLERTMLSHMLIQISALVWLGYALAKQCQLAKPHLRERLGFWRLPLLTLAICTAMIWMIPRLLDLAVESAWVDAAKMLSLPLLAGFPLYFAWGGFGPVVRGILHIEALATLLRLGWLYLASPSQLCLQYGLDDQQRLGQTLLFLGLVYGVYLLKQALFTPHFVGNEQAKFAAN